MKIEVLGNEKTVVAFSLAGIGRKGGDEQGRGVEDS